MASILPFSAATLGGTKIDTDEFVEGSGIYIESGLDIDATTADHARHYVRKTIHRSVQFRAYGDHTDRQTAGGLSAEQIIHLSSGDETFNGLVTAEYDRRSDTTLLLVRSDAAAA